MENHHFIAGKIHYFDWAMFNSYVSLPEGNIAFINPYIYIVGFINGILVGYMEI